jgi:hypothetical protein
MSQYLVIIIIMDIARTYSKRQQPVFGGEGEGTRKLTQDHAIFTVTMKYSE